MSLQELGSFIKDVGFPAFMSIYLIMSIGPKLDKLTGAITELVTIHKDTLKS